MEATTVKVMDVVLDPRAFCALKMTWRLVTDCVGVPEMIPVLLLSDNPVGSVPEETEYVIDSPVTVGVMEKDTLRGTA